MKEIGINPDGSPGELGVRRRLFMESPSPLSESEARNLDVAERAVVFPNVIHQGQTFRRPFFESRVNLGPGYNRELDTSFDEDARSRFFTNMAITRNTLRARLNAREHAERVQLSSQLRMMQKHRRKFLADVAGLVRPEPIEVEEPYDEYYYEPEEYGDYEQDDANISSAYIVEEPESEAGNLSGRSFLNESLKPRRLFH
ncbi:unnamed protein product [Timema podura]|uniref:Uncharacterized protein n=1 Tax=Timema podura TaxID=61482 RepID=A0ABN7NIV3_TIMPD|nr:unnamed protein product [Timema podura]